MPYHLIEDDFILIGRNIDLPTCFASEKFTEMQSAFRFTMHDKYLPGGAF